MSGKMVLFVIVLLITVAPIQANVCAFDNAPAASLLFPFVVYDFNELRGGTTTEIIITNVGSEAQVLHVTLWTDIGEPFLDFNILLTGYDVQRIDISNILKFGWVPITISSGHRDYEGRSDMGPVSSNSTLNGDWLYGVLPETEPTTALGSRCSTDMPGYPGQYTQRIPQTVLDLFRTYLSLSQRVDILVSDSCDDNFSEPYAYEGWPDPWFNTRHEYDVTWMYMTVDVVETCHRLSPTESAYWVPHTDGGQARYDNVLTGDIEWSFALSADAGKAVHIEADRDLSRVVPKMATGQPVSFYHRYSSNQGVTTDAREPLPTAWALNYHGAESESPPSLRVWKGSTHFISLPDLLTDGGVSAQEILVSNCLAYTYYAWDDEENVIHSTWGGGGPPTFYNPNLLPLAVQEVNLDQFILPGDSGWLLFVWPPSNYGQEGAPEPPDSYQTWMGMAHDVWGTHARFVPGTPMANANCFPDQILPNLGVDYDYVNRGGYSGRTGSVMGQLPVD